MAKINEATDTDLKVIKESRQLDWKPGDTLLYQKNKKNGTVHLCLKFYGSHYRYITGQPLYRQ